MQAPGVSLGMTRGGVPGPRSMTLAVLKGGLQQVPPSFGMTDVRDRDPVFTHN